MTLKHCNITVCDVGLGLGDEAQSIELFQELCGICRGQGRWEDPPQQLTDLAELMQSYGFPTPGWGDEEEPDRAGSHRDAASNMVVDQVRVRTCPFEGITNIQIRHIDV